jgi:hypothetical protein
MVSLLTSAIIVSAFSATFAEDKKKETACKRCGLRGTTIVVKCEKPLKNAKVLLNCKSTGWFSSSCYEWRGDLEEGDNPILLTRFTTEEGKKFNPIDYAVRTLLFMPHYSSQYEASSFDFTKD